eukprot:10693660-Alexandrium_andersonii.AAC.1
MVNTFRQERGCVSARVVAEACCAEWRALLRLEGALPRHTAVSRAGRDLAVAIEHRRQLGQSGAV